MRSYAQFENKIVKGGRAYARNRSSREKTGRTWRRLYETWEQGGLPAHYEASVVAEARSRGPARGHPAAGLSSRRGA